MCSIGEDDFGDEGGKHSMTPNQEDQTLQTHSLLGQCKKCKTENVLVYKLYFRDFECRDCFLANARHKFRATLGSSKVLPRNAKVLLEFDGSAEAVVLLDMLYHAQDLAQNNFKRLHCTVQVLYVDQTILFESEDKPNHFLKVNKLLNAYSEFESFTVSIASTPESLFVFKNNETYLSREQKGEVEFIKRYSSIRSLTSQQDFIKHHRNQLVINAAEQLGCFYIFKPDISKNLAMDLITAITLGRGSSAAYDVALVDDRSPKNIKIIRPLRDLNTSEVNLYLLVQQLQPLMAKADDYGVARGNAASIQNLANAFINGLQENYSATVSTVFRTCDKIAPNQQVESLLVAASLEDKSIDESKISNTICSFCKSPVEKSNSNTLLAIEFSRLVSEKSSTLIEKSELDSVARKNLSHLNSTNPLCHACRNIENDSVVDVFLCKT